MKVADCLKRFYSIVDLKSAKVGSHLPSKSSLLAVAKMGFLYKIALMSAYMLLIVLF